MDIKNKSENTSVEEFVSEKTELLEKIKKYEEEEKKYLEEKNRLNNLLQKLEEELKLSQKKDEEDYLISSGKENSENKNEPLINTAEKIIIETKEVPLKREEITTKNKENPEKEILPEVDKTIEERISWISE